MRHTGALQCWPANTQSRRHAELSCSPPPPRRRRRRRRHRVAVPPSARPAIRDQAPGEVPPCIRLLVPPPGKKPGLNVCIRGTPASAGHPQSQWAVLILLIVGMSNVHAVG